MKKLIAALLLSAVSISANAGTFTYKGFVVEDPSMANQPTIVVNGQIWNSFKSEPCRTENYSGVGIYYEPTGSSVAGLYICYGADSDMVIQELVVNHWFE